MALWVPRGLELDRFVTVDERLWLVRSANFYCALSEGDLEATFQSEHPGVTTMYAGMLGFLWQAPTYREDCVSTLEPGAFEELLQQQGRTPVSLLAAGRFFVVLEVVLALGVAFLYARRLLGLLPSTVGFLLIAFDPFFVAHTRLLHLDGLLSSFMLLSVLAFLSYLQDRRLRDLIVSGVAAGLSWLTKSPGLFLFPFMGLLLVWELAKGFKPGDRVSVIFKAARQAFLSISGWLAVGSFTVLLLWPAMWTDPIDVLGKIFYKATHDAQVGHKFPIFFNGVVIPNGRLGNEFFYFYPLTYLWRITPWVLLGLLFVLLGLLWLRLPSRKRQAVSALVVFGILFTVMVSLGTKKFDRYMLPIYPVLDLAAAAGWVLAARWLRDLMIARYDWVRLSKWWLLPLSLMGMAQMAMAFSTFPYYLSYYNPLMGGAAKVPDVMMIGWGEGLDQAARYLNAKPDVGDLQVFSWSDPACFSYFFTGMSKDTPTEDEFILDPEIVDEFFDADYLSVYIQQQQIRLPAQLLDYLALQTPEHSIWIDGLEYVRIYKLDEDLSAAPTYENVNALLGQMIYLEGYDLPEHEFSPGEVVSIDLSWRVARAPG
ncbi:MAG: glycosyltransferase family 39 protein, partial [Anaerolineae bacterium]|nr:glycosyltransferase family 39 protein [Anaerolineae bacterium]